MLTLFNEYPKQLDSIKIDLSDPTTHFGDRLFFFPLIAMLHQNGFRLILNPEDLVTREIFFTLYGFDPFCEKNSDSIDLVVIPKPSFLRKRESNTPILTVNFADKQINRVITQSLIQNFNNLFELTDQNIKNTIKYKISNEYLDGILETNQKYYLFNNYIQSGRFRKWFLSEGKLKSKCAQLKSQGYQIIHVGSKQDLLEDHYHYSFVDHDLRGRLSLSDFLLLCNSFNVLGAVTYDNFLMHIMGILNKKAFILFRGRFSTSNKYLHLRYVNNTFFSFENQPTYL